MRGASTALLVAAAALSGCLAAYPEEALPEPTHASLELTSADLTSSQRSIVVHILIAREANATLQYEKHAQGDSCGSVGFESPDFFPAVASGTSWVESSGLHPAASVDATPLRIGQPVGDGVMGTGSSQGSEMSMHVYPGQRLTLQLSLPAGPVSESSVSLRREEGPGPAFFAVESTDRYPFACGLIDEFEGSYASLGTGLPTVAREAMLGRTTVVGTTAWLVASMATPFSLDPLARCAVSIEMDGRVVASNSAPNVCNAAFHGRPGDVTFRLDEAYGRAPFVVYFLWDGDVRPPCGIADLLGFSRVPCMPQ